MQNYLYITSALTGPLGRRLANEIGYRYDEPEFDLEITDETESLLDRVVSPLTTIAFGCIDPKFQPTFILKAHDGEMREKIRAGNIFEKQHLDMISDMQLWLKKFEDVKLLLAFGHTNCAKIASLIELLDKYAVHDDGIARAIVKSPLRESNVEALNRLASMAYTLRTAVKIVQIGEVQERLDNGQVSVIPGYFASKIMATGRQNTLLIRDRTALYNYQNDQFELPENKPELDQLWSAKFAEGKRSDAIEFSLRRGAYKYCQAIERGDESLAISI